MKSRGYSSVHEFGQDLACSISGLAGGVHEFGGVRMSEPRDPDCYVGFGNVYGLSSEVELGQVSRSFSMQQSMYCVDGRGNPVEFGRGSLRKLGIRNIKEAVPELAEGFFFDFNFFCSENPCYVMNRLIGSLEAVVKSKLPAGSPFKPKTSHSYDFKQRVGSVCLELFGYEAELSFGTDSSGLYLVQNFCRPSEGHKVLEEGKRQKLVLETDEKGRLTNEGIVDLSVRCYDTFKETCKRHLRS